MPLLDDQLTDAQAKLLFPGGEVRGVSWRIAWAVALAERIPFRSRASGIEVPEPGDEFWRSCFSRCFLCGRVPPWPGAQLHHISRRNVHKPHLNWPENLTIVCGNVRPGAKKTCHDELDGYPEAQQLAVKWGVDCCGWATLPEFVGRYLRIADPELRAPQRIVVSEVEGFLGRAA